MAIWAGGDEQIFNRHERVLDAMGDQAAYIGPIGAGTIAKLVHNCTSAVMGGSGLRSAQRTYRWTVMTMLGRGLREKISL
jgi:3-hydroxyisobutyrate dehydrogenase-like beta-hydroxyacid dehydrogenase